MIKIREDGKPIRNLRNRIYGRILAEDAKVGRKLVETANGTQAACRRDSSTVRHCRLSRTRKSSMDVRVRSPLTDQSRYGISQGLVRA